MEARADKMVTQKSTFLSDDDLGALNERTDDNVNRELSPAKVTRRERQWRGTEQLRGPLMSQVSEEVRRC